MTHNVQITEFRQVADGLISVAACCCGLQETKSWHTMASEIILDDAAYQASVNAHLQRVAQLHETTNQALAKLPSLVGKTHAIDVHAPAPAVPATPAVAVPAAA